MDSLEKKEIRGLNMKSIYWIVATSLVICSTIMGTYFSIMKRFEINDATRSQQDRYDDLRIRTLDLNVQSLEIEVKELRKRQDELERNSSKND